MTGVEAFGVRRCRGCGQLLHAQDRCACDIATVHVITTLGPTDLPGLIVPARLTAPTRPQPDARPSDRFRAAQDAYTARVNEHIEDILRRHTR